jgi:hypothetical protein
LRPFDPSFEVKIDHDKSIIVIVVKALWLRVPIPDEFQRLIIEHIELRRSAWPGRPPQDCVHFLLYQSFMNLLETSPSNSAGPGRVQDKASSDWTGQQDCS